MTSEFKHEEISIMDYNGLSLTIIEGGRVMTGMDDWPGILSFPNVYGLKLVKHRVFLFAIECLHLSNATFIKTILYLLLSDRNMDRH